MWKKSIKILTMLLTVCACNFNTYALVMIEGVNILSQHPNLPTGCEATALAMLLQYYGVDVTKEQVASDMPKVSNPYYSNGVMYGEHPSTAFIGNPFGSGYGVFSPVIIDMINSYLPQSAVDLGGGSFDVVYDSLDKGEPVMIWVTINMVNVGVGPTWYTPSYGKFTWPSNEHAVVAVGYDDNYIYVNDPYTGSRKAYSKSIVESRWISLGRQAVGINANSAYRTVSAIGYEDITINGTTYEEAIRVDSHGKWIKATLASEISPNFDIEYDDALAQVKINITSTDNIQVQYDYQPTDKLSFGENFAELITPAYVSKFYESSTYLPNDGKCIEILIDDGFELTLYYKLVDGTTYIDIDSVEYLCGF